MHRLYYQRGFAMSGGIGNNGESSMNKTLSYVFSLYLIAAFVGLFLALIFIAACTYEPDYIEAGDLTQQDMVLNEPEFERKDRADKYTLCYRSVCEFNGLSFECENTNAPCE